MRVSSLTDISPKFRDFSAVHIYLRVLAIALSIFFYCNWIKDHLEWNTLLQLLLSIQHIWNEHLQGTRACTKHCVKVSVSCSVVSDFLQSHVLSGLSGSSVHGILQARILEWVAMPSSKGSSQPRDRTCISCIGRWVLYHLRHQGSPAYRVVNKTVITSAIIQLTV